MDQLEKKIKEFYQEKRREDEKLIPGFDAFWNKLEKAKIRKRPNFFFRIAASVAAIAIALLYYFYSPHHKIREISTISMDQPLPSQVFLDQSQSLGTGYIWEWKAPTDKLLENANELMNTGTNQN